MIRSAATICLVPQARGGPFLFWDDLDQACALAAEFGFDAVELFPPSAEDLDARALRRLLERHRLALAAVGTGAGWTVHRLRLTDPNPAVRARAQRFIAALIDFAGGFRAPAIIGSMQGRSESGVTRDQAVGWLREALEQLGPRAHAREVPLLFEPLNRYETDLVTNVADGLALIASLRTRNLKLLGDLFHMNLEERSLPAALRAAGPLLGHVHFVDSNRRPPGGGHTDFAAVATALNDIGYAGYLSAETLPDPTPREAAQQTITTFKAFFR